MRTWSERPFVEVVDIREVAAQGRVLGVNGGESKIVYEPAGYPGWAVKLYKSSLTADDAHGLAAIIQLPGNLAAADLDHVNRQTAWPVARVTEFDHTVGVMMAKAPDDFLVDLKLRGDRVDRSKLLIIDWLIGKAEKLVYQNIPVPSLGDRCQILQELLALGDLLERHNVVYGDWSYQNSLWGAGDKQIFLLDMDSCRLGQRQWIESMGWEDPLFPSSTRMPVNCYSDRYKLAVLAIRCITADRGDPRQAFESLPPRFKGSDFGSLVKKSLTAASAADRPTADQLLRALIGTWYGIPSQGGPQRSTSQPGNVTGYRPVRRAGGRPATGSPPPRPTVPRATPAPRPPPRRTAPRPASPVPPAAAWFTQPAATSPRPRPAAASRSVSGGSPASGMSGGCLIGLIVLAVVIGIIGLMYLLF